MGYEVNYIAIAVAGAAGTALGFIWYLPAVFGKALAREAVLTKETLDKRNRMLFALVPIGFLIETVAAFVLAHAVIAFNALDVVGAVQVGFSMGDK